MKKTTNAPMGAKVICVILTLCMLFSLTACNGSSNNGQQGAGMSVTDAPTMSEEHMGIEEPHQEINPGADIATTPVTDEPTAAPSKGYSYTIYGDVVITMDVNVDDYIITNNSGKKVFRLYQFAHDNGWTGNVAGDMEYTSDIYTNSSGARWIYGSYSDITPGTDCRQFRLISIVTTSYMSSCDIAKHDCGYEIGGVSQVASYDDIVLICYTLWLVSSNQETDPFANAFGTEYRYNVDSNGTEYRFP